MSDSVPFAVIASVPCFRTRPYVRRAVESLLAQTHRDLTVVVTADGDPDPPWAELAHIRDRRLIRFSLRKNHGPYFVHQVVLAASASPYFLIQDADDWSLQDRVSRLLETLVAEGSDMAFSAWQQYRVAGDGFLRPDSIRWRRREAYPEGSCTGKPRVKTPRERFLFDPVLTDDFDNRASHHGLFRRKALERIGGYYGGFRINYDTLLTNLLLTTGKVSFVDTPLYCYLLRNDSLSHSESTGAKSETRRRIKEQQAAIYREALQYRRAWIGQQLTSPEFMSRIRSLSTRFVTGEDRTELIFETARLEAVLRGNAL
jgi:glycosyltransferase involved in cell wall biosynthesis